MRPYCRKSSPPNLSKHRMNFNYSTSTTSATNATVERANSALRYLKTDFRISIPEDRFIAIILMYFYRDITLNYNDIINMYARKYPRRMLLQNP